MTSSVERSRPVAAAGPRGLAQIQDWLRLVATTPGGLTAGLAAAHARYGAGVPVVPPPRGTAEARLGIYARGYIWRLLACLESDYPALRALVGDELFRRFALDYLAARPPAHYSLFQLGAGLADHLSRTRPPDRAVPVERRSLLDLPIDLARLERARLECLRARGAPPSRPAPALAFELLPGQSELRPAPSLRLVTLAHDVRAFVAAVDHAAGGPVTPPPVTPRRTLLAVSRVAFRPVMTELLPWQLVVLSGCLRGAPVTALLEQAAVDCEVGEVLADLVLWLPEARALGILL